MKKKKIAVIITAVILITLLFPIKNHVKDGGTVTYDAVLYGITKQHSMVSDIASPTGESGYKIGTRVRILWFEVYNDVEFVPLEDK